MAFGTSCRNWLMAGVLVAAPVGSVFAGEARLEAEVTAGVAPLAVLFDARKSTDSDVADAFHELGYVFEFGEKRADSSYNKVWGLDGDRFLSRLSKDEYNGGPLAGHVYEKPGTYQARVTATDPTGESFSTTLTVTVADPNAVFPGTQTVCIKSGSGGFLGCPSGAEQRTSDRFDVAAEIASSGKRVLLRRGDEFRGNGDFAPSKDAILGAFGSGPRPRVLGEGSQSVLRIGGTGGRIFDIELVSPVRTYEDGRRRVVEATSLRDNVRRALVLRVKTVNGAAGFGLKGKDFDRHQVALVDCEIGDVAPTSDNSEGGKNLDGNYTRSMFLGNLIGAAPDGFNARMFGFDNSVFSFNKFNGTNVKSSIRIQAGAGANGAPPSENFIFSYNTYGAAASETAAFRPPSTSFYNVIRNYIVEGNFVRSGTSRMRLFGQNVSVRNNIKIDSGGGGADSLLRIERNELSKCDGSFCKQFPTRNIRVHNNTCFFSAASVSSCLEIESDVEPRAATSRKNLLYAPSASQGEVTSGSFVVAGDEFRGDGDPVPLVKSKPVEIIDFERVPAAKAANLGASIDGLSVLGDLGDFPTRPTPPTLLDVR